MRIVGKTSQVVSNSEIPPMLVMALSSVGSKANRNKPSFVAQNWKTHCCDISPLALRSPLADAACSFQLLHIYNEGIAFREIKQCS